MNTVSHLPRHRSLSTHLSFQRHDVPYCLCLFASASSATYGELLVDRMYLATHVLLCVLEVPRFRHTGQQ